MKTCVQTEEIVALNRMIVGILLNLQVYMKLMQLNTCMEA